MPLAHTTAQKVFYRLPQNVRRLIWRAMRAEKFATAQHLRRTPGEYSLLPFDEHRCIFVHIPKTAGISVSAALFGCLAGGHAPVSYYQMVFDRATYESYFKFTFVRNPWDRLYSAYRFLASGGFNSQDAQWAAKHLSEFESFEDFVLSWLTTENLHSYHHFVPQVDFIRLPGCNSPQIDFIGRFETLDEDFKFVCSQLGVTTELSHQNGSGRVGLQGYRHAYSAATRRHVAELYRDDIEAFGYVF